MAIEILKGNLLEALNEGIILTIDGAARGMEGNIARAFATKYPEVWEELEFDIYYPVPLGSALLLQVHPDLECQNTMVLLASTLNHLDVLTDSDKLKVAEAALRKSLSLAAHKGVRSVGTAVLAGGWRLKVIQAFEGMMAVYDRVKRSSSHVPILRIYVINDREFENIVNYLLENRYTLNAVKNGYVIGEINE
jgi:hypothetical protein